MADVKQENLKGLKFRTSRQVEFDDGNGAKKKRWEPVERDLALDDLLSSRDDGESFHIVTKDGKKYDIPKNPAKGKAGGDAA